MSSSYRKERYLHHTSEKNGKMYFIVTLLLLFLIFGAALTVVFSSKQELAKRYLDKEILLAKYEGELSILRTLNPYNVGHNEVLQNAVARADLFPGWVTRVYALPESIDKANLMSDLGTFVMNETTFSMASHTRYGIEQPKKSMYRLSALMPSHIKGRHQIGLQLKLAEDDGTLHKDEIRKMGTCYTQIMVNHKRVIDKRVNLVGHFDNERVVTGEVELDRGLFPISALIYCDPKSDFNAEQVQVSISFRDPAQHSLVNSRHSVFHIYNPENLESLL